MHRMHIGRLIEFFVIGVIAGMVEDLIAVYASTGEFSINILWIVALVAIPFAIVSELIVDHFKPFHTKKARAKEREHERTGIAPKNRQLKYAIINEKL